LLLCCGDGEEVLVLLLSVAVRALAGFLERFLVAAGDLACCIHQGGLQDFESKQDASN
jgi:hypothetical protein